MSSVAGECDNENGLEPVKLDISGYRRKRKTLSTTTVLYQLLPVSLFHNLGYNALELPQY